MYVALLAAAGFERVRCSGPTNFSTSPSTVGFDFVAYKPAAPPPSHGRNVALLVGAAALAVGVALALRRR